MKMQPTKVITAIQSRSEVEIECQSTLETVAVERIAGLTRLDISARIGTLRPLMRALFAFAVGLSAIGVCGCSKIAARDLVREGNSLYSAGRYREAIKKYQEAEELEPEGVTVFLNRAFAAESVVLALKESTEEADLAERKQYSDMALEDFGRWYDRLEVKTEEDAKLLNDNRLAVLSADQRCNDLIDYWTAKHQESPSDEGLYTVIARTYEQTCSNTEKAEEWYVKRTKDFPKSAAAWHMLAVRRFDPLFPAPDSGKPFNDNLEPVERTTIAMDVIRLANKATEADPKYRDPYIWRAMAYAQRSLARVYSDPPESPEEKLQAIMAREDTMLAWKENKAVCDIDSLPDCPLDLPPTKLVAESKKYSEKQAILGGSVVPESVQIVDPEKRIYKFDFKIRIEVPAKKRGRKPTKEDRVLSTTFAFAERKIVLPEENPPAREGMEGGGTEEVQDVPSPEEQKKQIEQEISEIVEGWKSGERILIYGKISADGKSFSAAERQQQACCPAAPLTPQEIEADQETRRKIEKKLASGRSRRSKRRKRG